MPEQAEQAEQATKVSGPLDDFKDQLERFDKTIESLKVTVDPISIHHDETKPNDNELEYFDQPATQLQGYINELKNLITRLARTRDEIYL